jgi:hypothetical protein
MKNIISITIILLLCFLSLVSNAQTENNTTPIKKYELQIPSKIESFLIKEFGLSSTGTIQVIGKYQLTHDCKLGKENDNIIHVIQQDLFGGRLFWSCLVNLTQEKVQVLYRCQEPDDFGFVISIDKKNS